MHDPISIKTTIRGPVPRIQFEELAHAALGAKYELSLVICGDDLARRVNRKYRNKTYSPNVLSFPLSPREGEIFLNVRRAAREARAEGVSLKTRVALLYVHGLYHLKGFDHGDKMESLEEKLLRRFRLL